MKIQFIKLTNYFMVIISLVSLISHPCLADEETKTQLPVTDIQRFTTIIEHIKNYYVTHQEDEKLFEDAIRGMLAGLDPHSLYLDQDEYQDLQINTSGKFGGLGIEITMEDGFIRIISPIDDTPAQKAGIKAGDLIIKLDDTQVKGLSLRKALEMMRGQPGTKIVLTLIRKGETKPLTITVTRAIINTKSVKGKLLEQNYAYIRISQFQDETAKSLRAELKRLAQECKNKKLQGLILDLRNNPGGLVDSAVAVTDTFLDKKKLKYDGLIVYTKDRMATPQVTEKATGSDLLEGAPIIVLVNGGSASASEIVAGALQDHKRAIIMGSKTFGKGSVQTVLPLKDKRGLKLTTALYYTPSGRSIQATGIEPDILVEDLKILPEHQAKEQSFSFSEADLEGHLENTSITISKDSTSANVNKDKLIFSDYVLHEALNLLNGINKLKN